MGKTAEKYLETDPWKVTERGFHEDRSEVSESVFSLANEHMGVRGYMEEGVSAPSLRGAYCNGVYEWAEKENDSAYKGIVGRSHYMVNAADWLSVRIDVGGVSPDAADGGSSDFVRELDMRTGVLSRSYSFSLPSGRARAAFTRFLDMTDTRLGYQTVSLFSEKPVSAKVTFLLSFDGLHWGRPSRWETVLGTKGKSSLGLLAKTESTGQRVAAAFAVETALDSEPSMFFDGKKAGVTYEFVLEGSATFSRHACVACDRDGKGGEEILSDALSAAETSRDGGIEARLKSAQNYWKDFWDGSDVEIYGDDENQQGIRYCVFQLHQTYHGGDERDNIGAKGLTGEAYSGHAFWDTETYCLPFYLFRDAGEAKSLLMYRYRTLPEARKRAAELDCRGACYPVATLNGREACDLWQHASLQFQASTGVAYGIRHYVTVTGDENFLWDCGAEMLLSVTRFLSDRGAWSADGTKFGFFCVMGPDEFQMMVNHNAYTNYLAKKTFEYTLETFSRLKIKDPGRYLELLSREGMTEEDLEDISRCAENMFVPYDEKRKLFEQHLGYFDLPHVDVDSIPAEEFPLYSHWSYDRIYRNDMIKQPDVLMFIFLFPEDFSEEVKRANYEFYEPRCIHESSLSPSVHSILASELRKEEDALKFFEFATRMDLDDYNRNTREGLHLTSIAAAWMNVVYGFGGLRSGGETLSISPSVPEIWDGYSFSLTYRGREIKVSVTANEVTLTAKGEGETRLKVYGEDVVLGERYTCEKKRTDAI